MRFWDSSAIVPLCIEEPKSWVVRDLISEDMRIAAWWGSIIECYSAFARLRRENIINYEEESQCRDILSVLSETWIEIWPSSEIKIISGRILLAHDLRAADALQLSAAILWANKSVNGHEFICFDARLRAAAIKEGFRTLPDKL